MRRQHTQPASIEISSDDERPRGAGAAPRPDDDEDDEDFLAFFSSRRGPAPAPVETAATPPMRRQHGGAASETTAAVRRRRRPHREPARRRASAREAPRRRHHRLQHYRRRSRRAREAFASRWPDASGAFTTPQSINDAPPANAFRRALPPDRERRVLRRLPTAAPLLVRHRRARRATPPSKPMKGSPKYWTTPFVCARCLCRRSTGGADAVIKLEKRHSRLPRLIWVQRGANAQKAVATWARTYMRRFDRTRGKNNDDPLDFLHGQCVDDVKRWKRARPTKHAGRVGAGAEHASRRGGRGRRRLTQRPAGGPAERGARLRARAEEDGEGAVASGPRPAKRFIGELVTSENPDFGGGVSSPRKTMMKTDGAGGLDCFARRAETVGEAITGPRPDVQFHPIAGTSRTGRAAAPGFGNG